MENKAFEAADTLNGTRGKFTKKDEFITKQFSMEISNFDLGSSVIAMENTPITFTWKELTIKIKGTEARNGFLGMGKRNATNEKRILDKVSGYCKPGELLAIMGASGAGKSTLLNALTFRNLAGLSVVGNRFANGVPVTPNSLTSVSAYVQQDDLFIGTLTVREHLNFQAAVRMDKHIPHVKRMERIEQVMQELGLKKCEKTLIGIQGRIKGISGGEMKRLAFASEVLTNPPLMFCDEPTSGLDSYMAQNVVEVLKKMAQRGKTIVATIHQPSSQVFSMFDRILLMAEGRVAFFGGTDEAINFFNNRVQLPCPMNFNPADHYIHVLAVTPGNENDCKNRIKFVCDSFRDSEHGQNVEQEMSCQLENDGKEMIRTLRSKSFTSLMADFLQTINRIYTFIRSYFKEVNDLNQSTAEEKQKSSPYKASWMSQFNALLWRSFLSVIKEPLIMQVRIMQTIVIAIILGALYFGQDNDGTYGQKEIMNINGAMFLLLTNMTFSNMFAVVNVFCMELPIFLREHFNGMYRTDVYYICKQVAELPLFIITPVMFVTIYYFMVGMNLEVDRFFWCCLICVLVTQVVVSFGYMISCLAPNLQVALALAPTLIIPTMIFGGFFLNDESIPKWLIWLKYLSWFMYSNELLNINQWENVNITDCNPTENSELPCFPNGETILTFYGFESDHWEFDIWMLVVLAVAFRIVGYFLLLMKTLRKSK